MLENPNENENKETEGVPKIVLLLVTFVFLLFPINSVIGKLHKSIGNQPKLIMAISIGMALMTVIVVLPIWMTRKKASKQSN